MTAYNSVRRWAQWAESTIARLVVADGLRCRLVSVTQGPLLLTFRIQVQNPSPSNLRRLRALSPSLAHALRVRSVRMADGPGYIALELPSPVQRTPSADELAAMSTGLRIAVGVDAYRKPAYVDLRHHGAIFWIGPSRRGKTQSMRSAAYALARADAELVIVTKKIADWRDFADRAACLAVVTDSDESVLAARWAAELADERARTADASATPIIVILDDLVNILADRPDIGDALGPLASMGAGVGVHLLVGTQEGGSKRGTGGAPVENNATARIVYKSNASAAARATGQGAQDVDQLTGAKGDALLLVDGEPTRVATGFAPTAAIGRLRAAGCVRLRPWLRTTGHNRPQPAQPVVVPPQSANGAHNGAQRRTTVAPVAWPINKRPPTAAERAAIRAAAAAGTSTTALCKMVYGHKDGKTWAYISEAIDEIGKGNR